MAFDRIIEVTIISQTTGKSILIKNLHMAFSVEKSVSQSANKANVQIWNLSEATRNFIKAKDIIIIRAGYEDEGTANLFFGNIQIIKHTKDTINRITEIEAYDGQYTIQNINISNSFVAGTPVQTVYNYIINQIGLPVSNSIVNLSGQYASGWAFAGRAVDALTEVLKYNGKTWSIQNQQISIHTGNEPIEKTGLVISPNTGLIGSPEIINNADEQQKEGEPVLKRWNVKSLLFPQLLPGALIKIISEKANGFFVIESIEYEADNYEGEFTATMDITEVTA